MNHRTRLAAAALALGTSAWPALAGGTHPHAHEHKPQHGGVVVEAQDIDYELVAKPTVLQLHLRPHGQPADLAKAGARLTLLSGAEKQTLDLQPAGDKLEAKGNFKLGTGTKAVAVVTIAGKPAGTVRFVLK